MAVATVIIGAGPHKGSHTAVAVGADEVPLGRLRVRACDGQAEQLAEWARAWPERTWAAGGARGTGYLIARQLAAAGETVLDVQPKLGARVRLPAAGNVNKNDPNDAFSVAVAALRSPCAEVRADDHAAVLKVWPERRHDLSRTRTQIACRLHAVLCELIPGGVSRRITAGQAARILESLTPAAAAAAARCELAAALAEDLGRTGARMRETRKKIEEVVRASGTGLFGVGPVVAATIIGEVRDVSRFAGRDHFASYDGTAPVEVSSGNRKACRLSRRGNRRLNHAIHLAAVTQISHRNSAGRAYYDKKLAEGKTPREAPRSLKRQVSDAVFARLRADAQRAAARAGDPGGQSGNGSAPGAAGSHPARRLFGQATPGSRCQPTAIPAEVQVPAPRGAPGLSPAAAESPPATKPRGQTTATLGREEGPRRNLIKPLDAKRHSLGALWKGNASQLLGAHNRGICEKRAVACSSSLLTTELVISRSSGHNDRLGELRGARSLHTL
jgi:transposase